MIPPDSSTRLGFVYILSNPNLLSSSVSRRPLLKIGATRKHPVQRARELAAGTGVPSQFTLSYFRDFDDCFTAETLIHRRLEAYRVNQSREFFDMELGEAIKVVDDTVREVASGGLIGGQDEHWELRQQWKQVAETPLPWSELFASFGPSDSNELTTDEREKCRSLAAWLKG